MSTNLYPGGATKLPILVESDFDQPFLLQMIAREPEELLYRSVYKALYGEAVAQAEHPSTERSTTTSREKP